MTDQQALDEAMRRWGTLYPNRVFCATEPALMAGVIKCPGDRHRGFTFTGPTWEAVFRAHDEAVREALCWKVRAVARTGDPIERVVGHPELAALEWDPASDWTVRVKRTPRKRDDTDTPPEGTPVVPTRMLGSESTRIDRRPGGHSPT